MHPAKQPIVAISGGGVGTIYGIIIALKGGWGFAHVAVGTTQEVVGTHALIGGAVTVEPLCCRPQHGVASYRKVVTVEAVSLVEDCQHTTTLTAAAGCEQQERK